MGEKIGGFGLHFRESKPLLLERRIHVGDRFRKLSFSHNEVHHGYRWNFRHATLPMVAEIVQPKLADPNYSYPHVEPDDAIQLTVYFSDLNDTQRSSVYVATSFDNVEDNLQAIRRFTKYCQEHGTYGLNAYIDYILDPANSSDVHFLKSVSAQAPWVTENLRTIRRDELSKFERSVIQRYAALGKWLCALTVPRGSRPEITCKVRSWVDDKNPLLIPSSTFYALSFESNIDNTIARLSTEFHQYLLGAYYPLIYGQKRFTSGGGLATESD
jgi:hypothetical protein